MAASLGGGGAAYQQLRTPDDGLNQGLQNISGQAERRNRALREEGKALKDKIDKTTKDFKESLKPEEGAFEATVVGQDSFDDVSRNVANLGLERFTDYGEQANSLFDKGDYKGAKALQQRQQKIMNSFTNWNKNADEVGKSVMKVKKMQEENKLSPVDDNYPQLAEAILKNNYVVGYDDNDNMTIQWKEKNYETGEEKLVTKKASDIYSNSYDAYRKIPIQEKGGVLDQWKQQFGVIEVDRNTGNFTATDKGWTPETIMALDARIDGFLGDPENMSYTLYEASGGDIKKKGNPEVYGEDQAFTASDMQTAKDYLKELSLSLENRTESLKYTGVADRKAEKAADRKAAMDRLKLNLAADADKDKLKGLGKKAEDKIAAVGLYKLAKQISELDEEADESDVQAIIDNSEYGFALGGDLDDYLGFGNTEYRIKGSGKTARQIKDVFSNFKGFVKASGLELEDTDLKAIMANPSRFDVGATPTDADPLGLGIK